MKQDFSRRFLSLLTDNLLWKLFSLASAILLWFALVDAPELTTTISAPVEFKNFPSGLDLGADIPEQVQLQVSGPRDALAGRSFSRTAVLLDLSDVTKPGERTYDVPEAVVGLPHRVRLVRAVPFQLRILMERHISRQVPVHLRLPERIPNGYRIIKSVITPSSVVISGPENNVNSVEFVQTDPFDFGTIERGMGNRIVESKLHTFVENTRVRIDSVPHVDVKVHMEEIQNQE